MIQARELSIVFVDYVALERVSFAVAEGESFGILGPYAAGKTTLIKALAAVIPPTAGSVRVAGFDTAGQPGEVHPRVGYMPDIFGLYDDLLAWEYLDFFARAYKIEASRRAGRIADVLAFVTLEKFRDRPILSYDQEMRRRLGLAKALLHDPPILLLDDPAAGLDSQARLKIRSLLQQIRQLGKTLVIGSNILTDLAGVCDRLGLLNQGRLLRVGTAATLIPRLTPLRTFEVRVAGDPIRVRDRLRDHPRITHAEIQGQSIVMLLDQAITEPDAFFAILRQKDIPLRAYRELAVDLDPLMADPTLLDATGTTHLAR
jgi:ABC-2 type transport system ATP-binding protein